MSKGGHWIVADAVKFDPAAAGLPPEVGAIGPFYSHIGPRACRAVWTTHGRQLGATNCCGSGEYVSLHKSVNYQTLIYLLSATHHSVLVLHCSDQKVTCYNGDPYIPIECAVKTLNDSVGVGAKLHLEKLESCKYLLVVEVTDLKLYEKNILNGEFFDRGML